MIANVRVRTRVEKGLCGNCGERPLATKSLCEDCRMEVQEKARSRRRQRKIAGKCACGRARPASGRTRCKLCIAEQRARYAAEAAAVAIREVSAGEVRRCWHCGEIKALSMFVAHKGMKLGKRYNCKDCQKIINRKARDKRQYRPWHPAAYLQERLHATKRHENGHTKRAVEIDVGYLCELWEQQGGRCAIRSC